MNGRIITVSFPGRDNVKSYLTPDFFIYYLFEYMLFSLIEFILCSPYTLWTFCCSVPGSGLLNFAHSSDLVGYLLFCPLTYFAQSPDSVYYMLVSRGPGWPSVIQSLDLDDSLLFRSHWAWLTVCCSVNLFAVQNPGLLEYLLYCSVPPDMV